jgi:signal transduction histidine kinase
VLHKFLVEHRDDILERSRLRLAQREVAVPNPADVPDGLPLFLEQLTAILRASKDERGDGHRSVSASAALHGGKLLNMGLSVGQVVQDYGSICQSVTELADERNVAITAEEFHTFNRCLDDAIAQAVIEYQHQRDRKVGGAAAAHLGFLAHEMRNLLSTAMLTFDVLVKGTVGIHGSTGSMHGRSLQRMRVLIDRTLAEVRLEAGTPQMERVSIPEVMEEIEIVATLEATQSEIQLTVDPGLPGVSVNADEQILASAIANLVQNALKFTRPHGHIKVRAHTTGGRVLIDVQDECGGLPPGKADDLFRPFEQRGEDHSGLGLGLSISLKGIRANGGEIHVRDVPGSGCVFTVDLPRAVDG